MTNMTPQKCDFLEIKILTLRLRSCCPEIKMPILLRGTYAQKKVRVSCRYKKKIRIRINKNNRVLRMCMCDYWHAVTFGWVAVTFFCCKNVPFNLLLFTFGNQLTYLNRD